MNLAQQIALSGAGIYFLVGLITGIWKYAAIARSPEAVAHEYINILHRASLMYAMASLVVWKFAELSQHPPLWNTVAVISLLGFFGFAMLTYFLHALLKDTDNQLRKPYTLGKLPMSAAIVHGGMLLLIAGEVGGFLILLSGAWPAIWT